MKKFIIGSLIFMTACLSPSGGQPATSTPVPLLPPTETPLASRTPIPVTQPPELTASQTLEPSPTPIPRFFTAEFDSPLAGWVILQAGNDSIPNIRNENSNLVLQMDSPFAWLYALYSVQDYSDVRVDSQFVNQAGSPSSIGLICRYSESKGWFEYNISTDGTYNLLYGKWLANGIADYLPILSAASREIQPSGASQKIGLICAGAALSLFVNETLIRRIDIARYELTEGKVGVTASSFENVPVMAAFDWVKVSEP